MTDEKDRDAPAPQPQPKPFKRRGHSGQGSESLLTLLKQRRMADFAETPSDLPDEGEDPDRKQP